MLRMLEQAIRIKWGWACAIPHAMAHCRPPTITPGDHGIADTNFLTVVSWSARSGLLLRATSLELRSTSGTRSPGTRTIHRFSIKASLLSLALCLPLRGPIQQAEWQN